MGPCFHGTARPQVVDRGYALQKWRVAVNMLNKQPWTADRGGPPAWGLVEGLTTPHHKKETVTNHLDKPRNWRNKKRDYLKGKLSEIETNSKNIRDLYKGIKEFKKGYQARVDVIKNENEELLTDSNSILNRWKDYFSQLLNVHKDNNVGEIEIQTAELLIPDPTLLEVQIAIEKLKKYKSLGIDQILAELIQDGGNSLLAEIYKLVLAIWKKGNTTRTVEGIHNFIHKG